MPGTDIFTWSDIPPVHGNGAERRDIPGAGASLRHVTIKAGTVASRHSHPHEQFILVLEGSGCLNCEAGTVELRPGTVIRFAPDAWHTAEFLTDTVLVEVNLNQTAAG